LTNKHLTDALNQLFFGTAGLRRKVSVEDAEARFAVRVDGPEAPLIPFGYLNREWKSLVAKMKSGDEIWEFETVAPRGDILSGVKLVRGGTVIDTIVAKPTRAVDNR
jgi:hypothetical protein